VMMATLLSAYSVCYKTKTKKPRAVFLKRCGASLERPNVER